MFYRNDRFFNYSNVGNPEYLYDLPIDIGDFPNQIKSYKKYLKSLKSIFKFKPHFRENTEKKLVEAKRIHEAKRSKDISTFVGVHIRRTDYSDHLKRLYSVEHVGLEYFLRAMDFFQVNFSVGKPVPNFNGFRLQNL